jgi:dolichol-phosphate mannosyltransferase
MIKPCLSVIIPIFNEEQVLEALYQRLTTMAAGLGVSYELVFVNDGSRDHSLELLKLFASTDPKVRVLDFSRNFGHQVAITAGMDYAQGEAVVVIDADLQDPPELIGMMLQKWQEGYDVVYAVREKREGDTLFKRATAALFYRFLKRITNVDIPLDTGDFRLMSRRAIEAMRLFRERNRFVRGLVSWIGFRQTGVRFVRAERYAGETKYPLKKMLRFAVDGIVSFSFIPLQLATFFGFLASGMSFLGILWVIYLKLFTNATITGWASMMVIMLFLGGVQLLTLGIVGEYIGRIYDEVKHRPLYLVQEALGFDPKEQEDLHSESSRRSPH